MTPRRSFVRKIIYLVAIAVLLVPIYWLSRPAVGNAQGELEGGVLAGMRQKYELAQSSLGEVDPASETMKLACLGMRGIAADLLWTKANEFKKKKDWANLSAALEQIVKIEPNFSAVWEHQAHNLAFNCSVEFDDYRQRYQWVIRGIEFLMKGIKINYLEPRLQWFNAFMVCTKIGRSDEKKQFRRLFKQDNDFHGDRPQDQRDNWLVGRDWYAKAAEVVDTTGTQMKGVSELLWRSEPAMALMRYAMALEEDGTFGDVAKRAWRNAANAWQKYGTVDLPFNEQTIRLGEREDYSDKVRKLSAQLDALQPGLRDKLHAAKLATLSAEQRQAMELPMEKRTARQNDLAIRAAETTAVSHAEVAAKIAPAQRKQAQVLAGQLEELENLINIIDRQRSIVNYESWRLRAQFEQEDDTLQACAATHAAEREFAEANLEPARTKYEQGFALWRKVLNKYPALLQDRPTSDDLMDDIKRYKDLLGKMDMKFPKPFVLDDVVNARPDREDR